MAQTITAIKARQNLGDVLNHVSLRHDEFIIKRGEHPMAAVIPLEKFNLFQQAARGYLLEYIREARALNQGRSSPLEDEKLLEVLKHQSRTIASRKRPL